MDVLSLNQIKGHFDLHKQQLDAFVKSVDGISVHSADIDISGGISFIIWEDLHTGHRLVIRNGKIVTDDTAYDPDTVAMILDAITSGKYLKGAVDV